MKKIIPRFSLLIILSFLLLNSLVLAQDFKIFWQKQYEDFEYFHINSIIPTSDDGFIIVGVVQKTAEDFNCWMMKFNHIGSSEWYNEFGGRLTDEIPYSCIQLKDKSYVVSGKIKDRKKGISRAWSIKVDSRGILLWEKTFQKGIDDALFSVCNAHDNGLVFAGKHNADKEQKEDAWILGCDDKGNIIWETTYGGLYDDGLYSIIKSSQGYISCGTRIVDVGNNADFWILELGRHGEFHRDRSFGGDGNDIALEIFPMDDGGYSIWGNMHNFSTNKVDSWLVKISNEGFIEWERTIGGFGAEIASSVIETKDDGFMIAGESVFSNEYNSNFWILKLDSQGEIEFDNEFIGPGKKVLGGVIQVMDGSYIFAGFNEQELSMRRNIFLVKFKEILNAQDSLYSKISDYVTSDYVGGMFLPIRRKRLKHFEPIIYFTDPNKIIAEKEKITPNTFIYRNRYFQETLQFQVETNTKTLREFNKEGVHAEEPVIKYYGRYGALFDRSRIRYIDKFINRFTPALRPRWQPRFEERFTPFKEKYELEPKEDIREPTHIPGRFSWKSADLFSKSPFQKRGSYFTFEQIKKPKQQISLSGYKITTPVLVPMIFLWLLILAAIVVKILFSLRK